MSKPTPYNVLYSYRCTPCLRDTFHSPTTTQATNTARLNQEPFFSLLLHFHSLLGFPGTNPRNYATTYDYPNTLTKLHHSAAISLSTKPKIQLRRLDRNSSRPTSLLSDFSNSHSNPYPSPPPDPPENSPPLTIMPSTSSNKPAGWTPAMTAFIKDSLRKGEEPKSAIILLETQFPAMVDRVGTGWVESLRK